ncbi:hypothetical protein HZA97_10160 [Candidatus Woesearchaeota archaeon]|nr:hypothetical protein [Candidatus Woesearchaeota archaeon]
MKIPDYRKEILNKKIQELKEKYGEINLDSLDRIGRDSGFSEVIHVPYLRLWGAVGEDKDSNGVVLYSGILPLAKKLDLAYQLAPTLLEEEQKYQNEKERVIEIYYFVKKLLGTNWIASRSLTLLDEIPSLAVYMSYPWINVFLGLPVKKLRESKELFKAKENRIKELGLEHLINEEVMPE